jgi:hypothetical protein
MHNPCQLLTICIQKCYNFRSVLRLKKNRTQVLAEWHGTCNCNYHAIISVGTALAIAPPVPTCVTHLCMITVRVLRCKSCVTITAIIVYTNQALFVYTNHASHVVHIALWHRYCIAHVGIVLAVCT